MKNREFSYKMQLLMTGSFLVKLYSVKRNHLTEELPDGGNWGVLGVCWGCVGV